MNKILITLMTFFALTTGANAACPELEKFIDQGVQMITTTLQCNGEAAIRADLESLAESTGFCSTTLPLTIVPQGFLCEVVAEVVGERMPLTTPVTWKCNDETTKDMTKMVIYEACELAMDVIVSQGVDTK